MLRLRDDTDMRQRATDPRSNGGSGRAALKERGGAVSHRRGRNRSSAADGFAFPRVQGRVALLGDPADLVVDALLRDAESVRDVLHARAEVQGALDAARFQLLEVVAENADPVESPKGKASVLSGRIWRSAASISRSPIGGEGTVAAVP